MDDLYSWKELISEEMKKHGESWSDMVAITLTAEEAGEGFDINASGPHGKPFTAWTENRVYFPLCHDGYEACGSVARNPGGGATKHQGN